MSEGYQVQTTFGFLIPFPQNKGSSRGRRRGFGKKQKGPNVKLQVPAVRKAPVILAVCPVSAGPSLPPKQDLHRGASAPQRAPKHFISWTLNPLVA